MTKLPITISKGPIYPSTLTIQFISRPPLKGITFLKPDTLFFYLHLHRPSSSTSTATHHLQSSTSSSAPVHIITKQARKDSSCQILCPSRGFREAQGSSVGDEQKSQIYKFHLDEKKEKVLEIKSGLDDAEVLIRKMDLEARSLQPSVKAMLLAKLRGYKSDLNQLKREFKRLLSLDANQAAHEELLDSSRADLQSVLLIRERE
ncbi:hypothetical protein LWI28_026171 [Acer negundo]|uniref:Vesicle transport v-SNARE N-terminal domain-containing protein n=1 Tax=Acer negundo TaxID=4023 RepID=A0AAD5IN49_ACENE|nr:hypothetical protein LWI28_026171 [Acer negundo]